MPEPNFGNQSEKELLKEAIVVFNKQKESLQDHILERAVIVPDQAIMEIMTKYNVAMEIAKVIYVLEFEYNLTPELSANYFSYEIARLKEVHYELPDIYSFLVRFSIEEGFWIKYLTIDFNKKMLHKISKLIILDRSLFGDLEGNIEDSALYILERSFIINDLIKPMIHSWVKDHHKSTFYNALLSTICGMRQKAREKGEIIFNELCHRLSSNINFIKGIISELDPLGWANKAIKDFDQIQISIKDCIDDKTKIDWRFAAELILENRLVLEYETLDASKSFEIIKENLSFKSKSLERKISLIDEEDAKLKSNLTQTLISLEGLSADEMTPIVHNLILHYYKEAVLLKFQKPTFFAKDFLEKILGLLIVDKSEADKKVKKFNSELTLLLSPMSSNEPLGSNLDEKVLKFLEKTVLSIISSKSALQSLIQPLKNVKSEQSLNEMSEIARLHNNQEELSIGDKLKSSSEKDTWILIRDNYLKELYTNTDELLAGAKTLKKMLLELGFLLTESEATLIIKRELDEKGKDIDFSNKEEIDLNICKVIYLKVNEQKEEHYKE